MHFTKFWGAAAALLLISPFVAADPASQVLATVEDQTVTAGDLERAVASSPYGTQFVAMDEDQQASLRGDLLKRLVASKLFTLEAKRLHLDQGPQFVGEVEEYRLGLLYRAYMDGLRARLEIAPDALQKMKEEQKGDPDGLEAAKSVYRAEQYAIAKPVALARLAEQFHFVYHDDRLDPQMAKDTRLAEGDGITVDAGELDYNWRDTKEHLQELLRERGEEKLAARGAQEQGIDVSAAVREFAAERLPALLLERKKVEWIPDEQTLRDYYDKHLELAETPERRHIGQLVVKTRDEAEALRKRILAGESLFKLAGELSIDPFGREHNGDMGWVSAGSGMPAIETALKGLEDGQVSEPVETPKGYHLVTIIERKLGRHMYFDAVRDRVERAIVAEHFRPFLAELEQRYPVKWEVIAEQPAAAAEEKR